MLKGEVASSTTGISEVSVSNFETWGKFFLCAPPSAIDNGSMECDLNIVLTYSIDRPAGLRCRYLQSFLHPERRG